jgi:hypothetical protein
MRSTKIDSAAIASGQHRDDGHREGLHVREDVDEAEAHG